MKTIDLLVQELPALGGWPDGAVEAGFLCSDDTLFFVNKDGDCPSGWRINMNHEVEDNGIEVTREQYEAALAAKNEGWIEWGGGECPVACGTMVDVKHRCGDVSENQQAWPRRHHRKSSAGIDMLSKAGYAFWRRDNLSTDIIAYRLHQATKSEQVRADAWNAYAGIEKVNDEAELNECIGQAPGPLWNGDGLPPVGCECEWQDKNTKQWNPVKVVYASEWVTVIREINKEKGDDLVEIAIENYGDDARLKFRPTRSEAERKRHDATQALCYAGGGIGKVDESAGIGSCWFDMYDAIAAGEIPGVKLED